MVIDSPLFKSEYPFKSHFLDLDGLAYHYLDEGQGEPIVMLHGNPSWSFYYRNLARQLSRRHRVIVPDHIGCGLSVKPADSLYSYHLKQRVDDLERLIDQLQLPQKITLVLHDWGGMIGMAWAIRHPQRVARLVLLNTAAFHLPATKKLPLALKICRDTQFGAFLVQGFNLFARAAARIGCRRQPMPAEIRQLYCSPYDNWQHRIATLRFVQDIPLQPGDPSYALVSDVEKGLAQFADRPVCICWGEQDFVFDHHFLKVWEEYFPAAEIHRFADCGHYVLEDAPQEIIPIIRDFLHQHPVAGAPADR
ncbi:MAG: alpha/beta fold hydrolase [Pelovirga sp.]